ncbi:hypothetical protein ONQ62_26790, partial [Salmonella enterica subsp. enterica serovar Virginia]|nr:hypothetical protein [Salmonella enterica subsp. enterica serovar Virginia]
IEVNRPLRAAPCQNLLESRADGRINVGNGSQRFCLSDKLNGDGAEIAVQLEGDRMLVRSGRSRFSLSTLPAADFPNLDDWQSEV